MWVGDLAVTQTQETSQGWDRHREVPAMIMPWRASRGTRAKGCRPLT